MIEFLSQLKWTFERVVGGLFEMSLYTDMWENFLAGFYGAFVFFVRVFVVITFPISVPILTMIVRRDKRLRELSEAAAITNAKKHYEKLIKII